jgi:hypothetical protein
MERVTRASRAAARSAAAVENDEMQTAVQERDEEVDGDEPAATETLEEGEEVEMDDQTEEPLEEADDAERDRIEALTLQAEAEAKAERRQAAKEKRKAQQELAIQAAIDKTIRKERERAAALVEEERLLARARETTYRETMQQALLNQAEEARRKEELLHNQIEDLIQIDEDIVDTGRRGDNDEDSAESGKGESLDERGDRRSQNQKGEYLDEKGDSKSENQEGVMEVDPLGAEANALEDSRKRASATAAAKAALAEAKKAEDDAARKLSASQDAASMARIKIATRAASEKASTAVECLTPGQAMSGVLDYNKPAHAKLWKEATMTLTNASEAFSVTPENFADLVTQLKRRASNLGWYDTINMIPTEMVPDSPKLNLMENYRELDLAQIELHDVSYIAFGGRKAQDSRMMFEALWNSLSREGRSKLGPETSRFHITVNGRRYPSGNLLFKIIADKSVLTTRGTSRYIKSQLALIPEHLATLKFNIASFHEYVKSLVMELQAGGEEPLDLNRTLMMAYNTVPGQDFKQYINHLQDQMDGNSPDGKTLDWHYLVLMAKVENKYKTMNLQKTWSSKPDNQEMIALKTELRQMKKKWKGKPDKRPPRKGPRKTGKPDMKKRKAEADFNRLKKIKPEDPATAVLEHKGKTFKWCGRDTGGHCEQFVLHKPAECEGKLAKKPPPGKGKKSSKKSASLIVNTAAAYNEDDSDEEMEYDTE